MASSDTQTLNILAVGLPLNVRESIIRCLRASSLEAEVSQYPYWNAAYQELAASEHPFDLALLSAGIMEEPHWNERLEYIGGDHGIPSVMLTSKPSRDEAEQAYSSGIKQYIEVDTDERYLVYLPHTILHLVDHSRAHQAKQSMEQSIARISSSISTTGGKEFFRELTRQMSETLGVEYAFIGEIVGRRRERIQTLAYTKGDKQLGNIDYYIAQTPCISLMQEPVVIEREGVWRKYPRDKHLATIRAQAYIGVPLKDAARRTIGVLCLIHSKPIRSADFIVSAMKIFASRAEMELERARAQEALMRQARIMEQLGEAVIGADIEGRIRSWNQQAATLFGMSKEEALGRSLVELLPDADEKFINEQFVEPLLIHGNHVVEPLLKRANGEAFHAHLSLSQEKNRRGEVVGVIACCRDISARREAEDQLREAKQRLEFHVQRTPMAHIEWDTNCHVVAWNPSAEDIFGYNVAEIVDQSFELLVSAEFVEPCRTIFQQLMEQRGGLRSTNENMTKDGRTIVCEWYNTPLINEKGEVVGVASLVNDITDRKRYEQELKTSKEAADTANRSKDEFLAVMSHEIRTPMNSIIGFADLLREQSEDANQHETIDIIKSNAYTLLELINNVLNYSRLDSGNVWLEKRDTDIPLLLNEVVEAMGAEASQKNLKLDYQIDDKMPTVLRTDYLELRQILLNLVGNAIKFTHEGEISISVSASPVSEQSENWTYLFAVRDTGVGIPKDKLSTLFQSFSQVDSSSTRQYGGTGLGLAICRKICHLLGGRIWADSHPGKGSTFYFTIEGHAVEQRPLADSRAPFTPDDEPARILLVEDEEQTRQLLQEFLKQMGHHCETADSGENALKRIREKDFDIVFMDVEMTGMSGLEATRRIRNGEAGARRRDIFICALTAYTFGDDKQACLEAGMNEHLGKPILTNNLKNVVSKAQQRKTARRG